MAVSAKLDVSLSANQVGSAAFGASPAWSASMMLSQVLANGTGANQIDIVYMAERTVTTGANDDIDLAGVLTDALGTTITAAEVVAILIINKQKNGTANTTNLTIGNAASPFVGFLGGTTPTVGPIRPGGMFLIMNPDASGLGTVTASSADLLRVANSAGASNVYQICILARTA